MPTAVLIRVDHPDGIKDLIGTKLDVVFLAFLSFALIVEALRLV